MLSILEVSYILLDAISVHRNMTYIQNVYLTFLKLSKWKLNVLLGIFIAWSAFIIFFWVAYSVFLQQNIH